MPAEQGTVLAVAPAADPWEPRRFRVVSVRRDTHDTVTLGLTGLDADERGSTGLAFLPGQFTMLQAFGVGEVPISISGDPRLPALLTHTIRDVGGVTRTLCAADPGQVLGVRGPFGRGWGVHDAVGRDVVVVAGGIGLAPLRPALLELVADRDSYGRVTLVYGARTDEDVLYGDELAAWAEAGIDVALTVDVATAAWSGQVGLVTELLPAARFDPGETLVLACGPEVMMRHVATALVERGVAEHDVRLSMERNMRCGIGLCGHCQLREHLVCVDGPVFTLDRLRPHLWAREL